MLSCWRQRARPFTFSASQSHIVSIFPSCSSLFSFPSTAPLSCTAATSKSGGRCLVARGRRKASDSGGPRATERRVWRGTITACHRAAGHGRANGTPIEVCTATQPRLTGFVISCVPCPRVAAISTVNHLRCCPLDFRTDADGWQYTKNGRNWGGEADG